MGQLLAVKRANYMVQAPICNSGDRTFPQALGALREVLNKVGPTQVRGEVAQGPPGWGWLLPLHQEDQKSDIWENFLTYHCSAIPNL